MSIFGSGKTRQTFSHAVSTYIPTGNVSEFKFLSALKKTTQYRHFQRLCTQTSYIYLYTLLTMVLVFQDVTLFPQHSSAGPLPFHYINVKRYTTNKNVLAYTYMRYIIILSNINARNSYVKIKFCFISERKKACCILYSQHESTHLFNNFLSNLLIWQREIKYLL